MATPTTTPPTIGSSSHVQRIPRKPLPAPAQALSAPATYSGGLDTPANGPNGQSPSNSVWAPQLPQEHVSRDPSRRSSVSDKVFVNISTFSAPEPALSGSGAERGVANVAVDGLMPVDAHAEEASPYDALMGKIPADATTPGRGIEKIVQKRKRKKRMMIILAALLLVIVAAVAGGVVGGMKKGQGKEANEVKEAKEEKEEQKEIESVDNTTTSPNDTIAIVPAEASPTPTMLYKPGIWTGTCPTGDRLPFCSDFYCLGINSVRSDEDGKCTDGEFKDCPCKSVCSDPSNSGPCDYMGCNGMNGLDGALGVCQGGNYRGCFCRSLCGTVSGSCKGNGCVGVDGRCTQGKYQGCGCK